MSLWTTQLCEADSELSQENTAEIAGERATALEAKIAKGDSPKPSSLKRPGKSERAPPAKSRWWFKKAVQNKVYRWSCGPKSKRKRKRNPNIVNR
jgi:hypothetical protein